MAVNGKGLFFCVSNVQYTVVYPIDLGNLIVNCKLVEKYLRKEKYFSKLAI